MRVSCNTVAGQNYNHTPKKKKVLFIIKRTFPVLFPNLKCHSLVSSNKTAAESSWLILLYCRVNASHFRPMAVFLWPDYRKYLSPEILLFPINDLPHRHPSKKSEKSGGKIPTRACTLVEFKEKNSRSVFHNRQITSEPLFFRSMRQAQNTDTHALNQLGASQNSSPLWSNFAADKHIWHPPWAWM